MSKIFIPKCNKCGSKISPFITGGLPNGIGFQLETGETITLCKNCIMKLGAMNDTEKDKFFNELLGKEE